MERERTRLGVHPSRHAWLWFAALSLACGATPEDSLAPPSAASGPSGLGGGAGSAGGPTAGTGALGTAGGAAPALGDVDPLGHARCVTPAGVSGSPRSIEEAIALLNALPKPTSVACFVEALDRPLAANATNSFTSAQPALSSASPRVFLRFGSLWLSIVIDGDASDRIEFGALNDELRSIKAEVQGPFTDTIAPSAPYDRILYGSGTGCGLCHGGETQVTNITFATAFESTAFRPRPSTHVELATLSAAVDSCDWQAQPNRCEMLWALFGGGPVAETDFPSAMPTFF
jgi:hypothetical protein